MLDSGYQLLPHDMATKSLLLAKSQLDNVAHTGLIVTENVNALATALKPRIEQPHRYAATNLEACSDVVGLYTEFEDYTSDLNDGMHAANEE